METETLNTRERWHCYPSAGLGPAGAEKLGVGVEEPKLSEMSEDSMGRNMRGQEDVRNLIENGGVQDELRRQFSASSRGPNTFSF